MSYTIMRGFQAQVDEATQDQHLFSTGRSAKSIMERSFQPWWEGFATGLHEANQLTDEEYNGCIEYCSHKFHRNGGKQDEKKKP